MCVRNLCEFVKTGLLKNLCDFYLCVLALNICIATHGTIKIYAVQYLCDRRLTRIIHINKSHAEVCRFMVLHVYRPIPKVCKQYLSMNPRGQSSRDECAHTA